MWRRPAPRSLAEYQRQLALVTIGEEDLAQDSVGENPRFRALVAEWEGKPAGYAVFFGYYSTWAGRGLFLKDSFVRAGFRKRGMGRRADVTRNAVEEHCSGIHWEVLDWNNRAIEFYEQLGATICDQWRAVLLTDEALRRLAEQVL